MDKDTVTGLFPTLQSEYLEAKISNLLERAVKQGEWIKDQEHREYLERIGTPWKDLKRDLWYQRYQAALHDRVQFEDQELADRGELHDAEDNSRLTVYEGWLEDYMTLARADELRKEQRRAQEELKRRAEQIERRQRAAARETLLQVLEESEVTTREERRQREAVHQEEQVERVAAQLDLLDEAAEAEADQDAQKLTLALDHLRQIHELAIGEDDTRHQQEAEELLQRNHFETLFAQQETERYWLWQLTTPSKWGEQLKLPPSSSVPRGPVDKKEETNSAILADRPS